MRTLPYQPGPSRISGYRMSTSFSPLAFEFLESRGSSSFMARLLLSGPVPGAEQAPQGSVFARSPHLLPLGTGKHWSRRIDGETEAQGGGRVAEIVGEQGWGRDTHEGDQDVRRTEGLSV